MTVITETLDGELPYVATVVLWLLGAVAIIVRKLRS